MSQITHQVTLVGSGHVAQTYREVIEAHPAFYLQSIIELKDIECPKGVSHYTSVDQLLRGSNHPHMAIICTPPADHVTTARKLLEGGIDCLVEKPLALSVPEAKALQDLADKLGRKLRTAGKFRFALHEAQEAIQRGEIGDVVAVENTFSAPFDPTKDWHAHTQISGGGVWMDNGPHALDVLETLAGPIEQIRLINAHFSEGIEEEIGAETVHRHGVRGKVTLSWRNKIEAPIAVCHGSQGEMMIGWNQYDKLGCFAKLLEEFVKDGNEDHGVRCLEWIAKGYKSLQTEQWESI